jgi:hypothetical protein
MSSSIRAKSIESSTTFGVSLQNPRSNPGETAIAAGPPVAIKPITQTPNTRESTPVANGLISKKYELPPLPKSGRKRLSDDAPPNKRVAQNRIAQRIHRDKRAERQVQIEARNRFLENEVSTLGADRAALTNRYESAAQEWKQKEYESQKQIQVLTAHLSKLQEDIMCGGCDENTPCACIESANASLKLQLPLPPMPLTAKALTPADFQGILQPEHSSLEMDHTTKFLKGDHSATNVSNAPMFETVPLYLPKPETMEPRSVGGMCDMCRTDPKRFILCKALGSKAAQSVENAIGAHHTLMETHHDSSTAQPIQQEYAAPSKVTLPCREVTTALMNHRGFEQASAELESWLGQLKGVASRNGSGVWDLDIEAASVLTTLCNLDRRFGSADT